MTGARARTLTAASLAAALLGPSAAIAQQPPGMAPGKPILVTPVDEPSTDPSWLAFKARFVDAASRRDRKTLLAAIDPNVDNGPDHKRGIGEFRTRWDWDRDDSPLWRELVSALSHGAAFLKGPKNLHRVCAPYVAVRWPSEVDPFVHGALTGREVLVKAQPSAQSTTIATLAYEVLRVEDWEVNDEASGAKQKWTKVRTRAGTGFVPEEQIRSPIEHLTCFVRSGNQWRLASMTAGDLPD